MLLSAQNVYLRIFIFVVVVVFFFFLLLILRYILFFGCCRCSWLLLKTFVSSFGFHWREWRMCVRLCTCRQWWWFCYCRRCNCYGAMVELSSLNMASQPASSQPSQRFYVLCIAVRFSSLRKSFFQNQPPSSLYASMKLSSHVRCVFCAYTYANLERRFSRKISLHIKRLNLNGTKLFSLCSYLLEIFHMLLHHFSVDGVVLLVMLPCHASPYSLCRFPFGHTNVGVMVVVVGCRFGYYKVSAPN